jgi:predicted AAA+ superfamily ATPase
MRLFMRPMCFAERGLEQPTVSLAHLLEGGRAPVSGRTGVSLANYAEQIVDSGFPGIRSWPVGARPAMLGSYIDEVLDRDIPELGVEVRRPQALRAWLSAYAAATATTAAYTTILDSATPGEADKPARTTVDAYRALLQRVWLLDPLPAWIPAFNPLRRLAQAPKHHLVDPALAARLLGSTASSLLMGQGPTRREDTLLAALFESLCVQQIRALAQACQAEVFHLRDRDGAHEIDIIVERPDHRVLAIEVKLAAAVTASDAKHLNWLERQIGGALIDKVVLTTGEFAFRDQNGTAVIPLALLGS